MQTAALLYEETQSLNNFGTKIAIGEIGSWVQP